MFDEHNVRMPKSESILAVRHGHWDSQSTARLGRRTTCTRPRLGALLTYLVRVDRRREVCRALTRVTVALAVAGIASGNSAIWIMAGVVAMLATAGWIIVLAKRQDR